MSAQPSSPVPAPDTVRRLSYDVYSSFAFLAALELDLFTPLAKGPLEAGALANSIQVNPRRIQNLLYVLVEAGLLRADGDRYANTEEAQHYLVRGSPLYLGGTFEQFKLVWSIALHHTVRSLRTGVPQSRWMDLPDALKSAWLRGLRPQNDLTALELARWDLSGCRTFADLAGGAGELSIALARQFTSLHATIFEHPSTVPITKQLIAEAGATERVSVVTADVIDGHLEGEFDAAAMRFFLQMLPEKQAIRSIHNAASVLRPGGALYVCDLILDDSRTTPREVVRIGVVFLNLFDSEEIFTESDYRRWMSDAGLVGIERVITPYGFSIMRGVKPA
jgi:SAM-dependent methyltransferase